VAKSATKLTVTKPETLTFDFDKSKIRAFEENGILWMDATAVCKILEYPKVSLFLNMLEPDERRVEVLPTRGGPQQINFMSESGLYTAVMNSRVPKAIDFKRWVTRIVLPEIRRTGQFKGQSAPQQPTETLKVEDVIRAMLTGRDDGLYVAAMIEGKFKIAEWGKYTFLTAEQRMTFDMICLFFTRAFLEFCQDGMIKYVPADAPERRYLNEIGMVIGNWILPMISKMANEAVLPPRQMDKELKGMAMRETSSKDGENPSIVRLKQHGLLIQNSEGRYVVNKERLAQYTAAMTNQLSPVKH
jgi:prophage antirepressor-like protein